MLKTIGLILFGLAFFVGIYSYNRKLLDWLRFQSLGTRDYVVERLQAMFIEVPSHYILLGMFGISVLPGSLVFLAFLPQLIPGLVFGTALALVGWKAPRPVVDYL